MQAGGTPPMAGTVSSSSDTFQTGPGLLLVTESLVVKSVGQVPRKRYHSAWGIACGGLPVGSGVLHAMATASGAQFSMVATEFQIAT